MTFSKSPALSVVFKTVRGGICVRISPSLSSFKFKNVKVTHLALGRQVSKIQAPMPAVPDFPVFSVVWDHRETLRALGGPVPSVPEAAGTTAKCTTERRRLWPASGFPDTAGEPLTPRRACAAWMRTRVLELRPGLKQSLAQGAGPPRRCLVQRGVTSARRGSRPTLKGPQLPYASMLLTTFSPVYPVLMLNIWDSPLLSKYFSLP